MAQEKNEPANSLKLFSEIYIPKHSIDIEKVEKRILPLPNEPLKYDAKRSMFHYGRNLDDLPTTPSHENSTFKKS